MTYDRAIIKMDAQALYRINTNTKTVVPPVYFHPFDERYSGGGFFALLDGKYGSMNHDDGNWQGYRDNNMDIMIDLGTIKKIASVSGNFMQKHEGWIFLPKLFSVSTAVDKEKFTLQGEIRNEIPGHYLDPGIHMLTIDSLDVEARYVRVKAVGIGPVPGWHEAARERPAWFFIDEIIIK
jgi:alpha-L-fucosidase